MRSVVFFFVATIILLVITVGVCFLSPQPEWKKYIKENFPEGNRTEQTSLKGEWRDRVYELEDMVGNEWTKKDVDSLVNIVKAGYPTQSRELGKKKSTEENDRDFGEYHVWWAANICLMARLQANIEVGAPLPNSARETIEKLWIEELKQEFSERRSMAAGNLIEHGFTENPVVRKLVDDAIDELDPDDKDDMVIMRANHDKAKENKRKLKKMAAEKKQ